MKFEQNIRTNDRQSSKGNQLKWENEGIWYKADYTGYEGLVEYMISFMVSSVFILLSRIFDPLPFLSTSE